jgi:acyl phosphate:glycerol-3-phosphate acyltransferase
MTLLLVFLLSYAIGSIPFGLLSTRLLGLGDVRAVGSGNIGATNVLRTGSKGAAAATLLLDALKGAVPVLIVALAGGTPQALAIAGLGAFTGHIAPVWLRFRGGKGVATFFGVTLALAPVAGLVACATWLLTAATTRYSSLSALLATVAATLVTLLLGLPTPIVLLCLAMTLLVFARHHANIRRLLNGSESRIGRRDP